MEEDDAGATRAAARWNASSRRCDEKGNWMIVATGENGRHIAKADYEHRCAFLLAQSVGIDLEDG